MKVTCVEGSERRPRNDRGNIGPSVFVLCRKVVLFQGVIFYRVCIITRVLLAWEVCPLSGISFIRGFTVHWLAIARCTCPTRFQSGCAGDIVWYRYKVVGEM